MAVASRAPLCSINNGSITIRVTNTRPAPPFDHVDPVYGQVRVTLMYRKLGTMDPLQPYPGAPVYERDLGTGPNLPPLTFDLPFENLGPNYYCIIVQTFQGCYNTDIEMHCKNVLICTYTQGGWGSAGGKMGDGITSRKYATTELINQAIGHAGGKLIIGSTTGAFLEIKTAQEVLDFLPNGGPSFTLTHTGALSLSSFLSTYNKDKGGSLIAQAITLGLNLNINAPKDQYLATIPLAGIVDAAVINVLTDKTVGGLYAFANQVIGGTSGTMGLSLSQIADALDAVNNFFDGCKAYNGPDAGKTASNPSVAVGSLTDGLASKKETLKVFAGPNPIRGRVQFQLESAVSGQGVLEVYNIAGVRLATPFRGYVAAGKSQTVNYVTPSLTSNGLLYVFRVNNEQVSGKLIAAK
jgi:hypothetical protein